MQKRKKAEKTKVKYYLINGESNIFCYFCNLSISDIKKIMKQAFTIILLCFPLLVGASSVEGNQPAPGKIEITTLQDTVKAKNASPADWTIPGQTTARTATTKESGGKEKKPETQHAVKLKENPKYLAGAVPTDKEGKIIFTLDERIPGRNEEEIYDSVYHYLSQLTKGKDELKGSRIALVSTSRGVIAAPIKEWMTFKSTFLSVDRAQFMYTIIAQCSDQHLKMTISRLSYIYEEGRPGGFYSPAEEIITDKYALTKKKNDLARMYGKFRKYTIDRKDEIFKQVTDMFRNEEDKSSH
jgi:colicin import membrane protein